MDSCRCLSEEMFAKFCVEHFSRYFLYLSLKFGFLGARRTTQHEEGEFLALAFGIHLKCAEFDFGSKEVENFSISILFPSIVVLGHDGIYRLEIGTKSFLELERKSIAGWL